MGENVISGLITIATAIIGLAIIATLVSRNANTAGVLQAGGNALATGISAATGPVSGFTGSAPEFGMNNFTF